MEGVTGMMAWLSHVPGCSRAGLYGPANIDFRFVSKLRLQRASKTALAGLLAGRLASPLRRLVCAVGLSPLGRNFLGEIDFLFLYIR